MTYSKFTDVGNREVNEDYVDILEKDGVLCCVLCDGLGGHGRGEEASTLVVNKMIEVFKNSTDFINHLDDAFEEAQAALLEEQKRKLAKFEMKTTATLLTITEDTIRWGFIGDSRLYLFKKGKYKTRTLDHSVPQMLVRAKEIKEKEIRNHPDRNKLLRVMGVEWGKSKYELSKPIKRKDKYAFLICSDGFWELIDEAQMSSTLKESKDASEWVEKMAEIVRQAGKDRNMDNFSAITVIL